MVEKGRFLENKRVLVTGACGTVGSQLLNLLLTRNYNPAEVVAVDNNESGLFFLEQQYLEDGRGTFFLGDVRDRDKLSRAFKGIDVVFHTAAFKHVVLCERSPFEAVQTNIIGVQNVILAANENGVGKVIFTSSDKAVNPTNVMGTSKLMGERIMTAANSNVRREGPIFASTRFGNVLGSRGSVIPIFKKQISKGGPVTLTDPGMTRFVMSISDAVKLVVESSRKAQGGDVFITKMPVIRIKDLAEVMIEVLAPRFGYKSEEIEIKEIGTKPGEKQYEELMSEEEIRRTVELEDFFIVLPAFRGIYRDITYDYEDILREKVEHPYNSANEKPLSKSEVLAFLKKSDLLDLSATAEDRMPAKRYWPGERD